MNLYPTGTKLSTDQMLDLWEGRPLLARDESRRIRMYWEQGKSVKQIAWLMCCSEQFIRTQRVLACWEPDEDPEDAAVRLLRS